MRPGSLGPVLAPPCETLICPACHGSLQTGAECLRCLSCARSFSFHQGIPDLRVHPDPFLGFEQDRQRAERVLAALQQLDLPRLLDHYWSLSDSTPAVLRARFVRSALRAPDRARRLLERLEREALATPASRVLEIGSGTAAFLAEAAGRVGELVGLDIALRWLHLGRRRVFERGAPTPTLVCACAEALPFPDAWFDLVVCTATLEFIPEPERLLREAARVLRDGGALLLSAVNRFSLAPEPHVGLWGVGFLPRSWQAGYVRWRGGGDFTRLRLLSLRELEMLARRHFGSCRFEPAEIPDAAVAELGGLARLGVRACRGLAPLRPVRLGLLWFGPEWEALLRRPHRPAGTAVSIRSSDPR